MEFIFDNNRQSSSGNSGYGSNTMTTTTVLDSPRRTRKSVPSSVDDIEISKPSASRASARKRATSKVTYVKSARKQKRKEFNWTWNKVGWAICAILFVRLIFMDNGVIDYYEMETTLEKNAQHLELIKEDNADLVTEIHEIKTNAKYQKKLAREHLGVIAQNEYLILFAKDS